MKVSYTLIFEEYLGEMYLVESSRNSIPFNENTILHIQDSLGNETIFQIDMEIAGYRILDGSFHVPCELDNSLEKIYTVRHDQYKYDISEIMQSLNVKFRLSLNTVPSYYPFNIDTISDQLRVFRRSKTDTTA